MQKFGIDISKFQGSYNITQAKAEGVEFCICRIGGSDDKNVGKYKDSQFENNYNKCKVNNVPIGCYYLFNAYNEAQAVDEAEHFLSLMKGKQFEYPVALDIEGAVLNQPADQLCKNIDICAKTIEAAGYYVVLYMSASPYKSKCKSLKQYDTWIASYTRLKPVGIPIGIWQFGGSVNYQRSNTVAGQVTDQNYAYKDYEKIIKNANLNGFDKPEVKTCKDCFYSELVYRPDGKPTDQYVCCWNLAQARHGVVDVSPSGCCTDWSAKK